MSIGTHGSRAARSLLLRVSLLAAALLLLATALPAASFSSAFYPTQSRGDRGSDVRAIQYLLRARGIPAPVDGAFGASTADAVKRFQARVGLTATGVVTPTTWGRLVMTVRTGSTGYSVRAVESLLNAKRRSGLTVDGTFTSATRTAVISFQRHVRLSGTGVVDAATWRNLAWHYEYPDFGPASLCDYTDTTGNGTAANWGTASAVASIESAARSFYGTGNGGVALGDLSWEHGGNIGGHASHEDGMDIDVRAIRLDERQCAARGGTTWRSSNYDRAATRQLVKAVRAAAPGHIKLIYFNDPVLVREGLVTSYSGHDGHLHVRYCERGHPDSRYRCSASSSSTEADPPNVDPTLAPALTDESMPRRWR